MLRESLFLLLAIVFFGIWLISTLAFHVVGGLLHLLWIIGVIFVIIYVINLFNSRRGV